MKNVRINNPLLKRIHNHCPAINTLVELLEYVVPRFAASLFVIILFIFVYDGYEQTRDLRDTVLETEYSVVPVEPYNENLTPSAESDLPTDPLMEQLDLTLFDV